MRCCVPLSLASLLALVIVLGPAARPPVFGQDLPRIEAALSRAEAVNLALKQNLQVFAAREEVEVARQRRLETRAGLYPTMSTTSFLAKTTVPEILASSPGVMPPNITAIEERRFFDQNVTLMVPLFTGGRLRGQVRAATAQERAARTSLGVTDLDVRLETSLAYVDVLRAQEAVRVYEQLVRDTEERVRVSEELLAQGRIALYVLLRDRTELANARQMLVTAQKDVDVALTMLKTTLGVALESHVTLTDRLAFQPVAETLAEAATRALAAHPEIVAAAHRRDAGRAEITVARSAYYPQAVGMGMFDYVNVGKPHGTEQTGGFLTGLVVSVPLFDGFQRRAALNGAQARERKLAVEERAARQRIARDVTLAWLTLTAAAANVAASEAAIAQAEEEYRIVQERFRLGRGIQVEVLDALVALVRARFNRVQALAEHAMAAARLERAVGAL